MKYAEYEENAEPIKLAILHWLNLTRVKPCKTCDDYVAERAAVSEWDS
jgi:coenzyme F420-reducing hydrogenase beta subunit